jgi:glycosyltransferase involved in cell wall biosynthesis
MKALLLGHIDPLQIRGGAERLIQDLARELTRNGDVVFATAAELDDVDLATFDLVHVTGAHTPLVARARRARRPKVVVTFHGAPLALAELGTRTGRGGVFRLGQAVLHSREVARTRELMHVADAVLAVSKPTGAALARQSPADSHKIVVIENGVDTERFTPDGAHNDGFVLFVGRLERSKGIDRLVRAFKDRSDHLIVAGAGSLRRELELVAGPRVQFEGEVSDTRLVELYRSAAVCVFPSLYEGFGLVALEALACGTPTAVSEGFAVGPPAANLLEWFPIADDTRMLACIDSLKATKSEAWSRTALDTVRRDHDVRGQARELHALYHRLVQSA